MEIQLWGAGAKSHIAKMEAMQSIILRTVTDTPWYIRNEEIRRNKEEIQLHADRHKARTTNHSNTLAKTLYFTKITRRLKKKHPQDLLTSAET